MSKNKKPTIYTRLSEPYISVDGDVVLHTGNETAKVALVLTKGQCSKLVQSLMELIISEDAGSETAGLQ